MSGYDASTQRTPRGGDSCSGSNAPEEVGGGGGRGGWRREDEGDDDDWEDALDSYQLEKRMRDRRRAKSLPANLSEAETPVNGEGRKRVKFADSIGLNLASVKHFNTLEEPQIPTKVLSRLQSYPQHRQDLMGLGELFRSTLTVDRLVRCFPDPAESCGFESRVRELRVCLERVTITQFDVRGQIRVCAAGPNAEVGVRYTFNDWLSHVDAQALAVAAGAPKTPGVMGERFAFSVYTPPFLDPSSSVRFAVYLKCDEGDFWDNNAGQNYTLRYQCLPAPCSATAAFDAT